METTESKKFGFIPNNPKVLLVEEEYYNRYPQLGRHLKPLFRTSIVDAYEANLFEDIYYFPEPGDSDRVLLKFVNVSEIDKFFFTAAFKFPLRWSENYQSPPVTSKDKYIQVLLIETLKSNVFKLNSILPWEVNYVHVAFDELKDKAA